MQDKFQGLKNTPTVTERRSCPRLRVTSLIYIDIDNVNGGIVTSLSENGLALTAAANLATAELADGPRLMRIQFPGTLEAIEASGQIAWMSSSGKEACLRFVGLDDRARDQIRKWISDQISSKGLRPETPKLPKMKLPNSRRAAARASRFSFADVASSRVDAEGEAGVESLPEIDSALGELPPLQVGGATFRDGAEAVASAFESPVFTEGQAQNAHSVEGEQKTRAIPEDQLQRQPSPSIPERRQLPRKQILLFTYAVLGDDNGGLVFNLGEGGLALTAAAPLREHHFAKIRLRFPDSADWIDTSGRLAWKDDSGKEAGIELLNLPEDVRARIREWVSREEQADGAGSKEDEVRAGQGVQELPHFMDPEGSSTEPFEIPASFQEQPFEDQPLEELRFEEQAKAPAPSSSALFETGIKGILERASVRRRVAKIKPPQLAGDSVRPPTRVARKALASAAGVALAVGGWMFLQRTSTNQASGVIAQNLPNTQPAQEPGQEPAQKPDLAKAESGSVGVTADPPVQPKDNTSEKAPIQTLQTDAATPSVQRFESPSPQPSSSKTAAASSNPSRTKEKPPSEKELAQTPAANTPQLSLDQAQRPANTQSEPSPKSSQISASAARPSENVPVANKAAENKLAERKTEETKPVQIAQTLSTPKDLNSTPPSVSSNPPQPAAAPPVDLAKEKPAEPPKQPEPLVTRTPVVSVSFDPFPSIRMPKTEKSKKSHQGKSLQMGRLLSRVDPVYPEEARQQGVEGTAKLHAIFNRDGSVQSVISLSGPPPLVAAAMKAVQQWHYSQTILGGQAMETEEDVTVLFRLGNLTTKN